jgi:MSHA pilin protein MshD
VELTISIVVIAIAVGVVLGTITQSVASSADPMQTQQAVAIAEAYLEEILLRPTTDPDGSDGETARSDFDDVDDYDGLFDSGARDQFDTTIAGLGDYDVAVSVVATTALPGVPSSAALRVDVTVSRAPDVSFTVSGYRTGP